MNGKSRWVATAANPASKPEAADFARQSWEALHKLSNISGKPGVVARYYLPEVEGKLTKEILESFTDMIMVRIAYLLPDNYRGVYKNEFNEMDLH